MLREVVAMGGFDVEGRGADVRRRSSCELVRCSRGGRGFGATMTFKLGTWLNPRRHEKTQSRGGKGRGCRRRNRSQPPISCRSASGPSANDPARLWRCAHRERIG